jgi:hypothetical protein
MGIKSYAKTRNQISLLNHNSERSEKKDGPLTYAQSIILTF